jgi:hypothetical protein
VVSLVEGIIKELASTEDQEIKCLGETIAWIWENDIVPTKA